MPKIRQCTKFVHLGGLHEQVELIINYTKGAFTAKLPEKYNGRFDLMDQQRKENLGIMKEYTKTNGVFFFKVSTTTEKQCDELFCQAVKAAMELELVTREVIIVYSDPKSHERGGSDHNGGKSFPRISINFGFDYAIETQIGTGDPKYHIEWEHEFLHETRMLRQDVRISNYERNHYTIIDDTPENRIALEDLYSKLSNLRSRLEMIQGQEALLNFISSNQKLLN